MLHSPPLTLEMHQISSYCGLEMHHTHLLCPDLETHGCHVPRGLRAAHPWKGLAVPKIFPPAAVVSSPQLNRSRPHYPTCLASMPPPDLGRLTDLFLYISCTNPAAGFTSNC